MKTNKMKINLDILEHIGKVEAPPFLFTRINAKIDSLQRNKFSPLILKTFAASFLIVLLFNSVAMVNYNREIENKANLAQQFDLVPHNSFYNE